MGGGRHKLTIRLDPDVWEGLQRVADVNGVTVNSLMQAIVQSSIDSHASRDWTPIDQWEEADALPEVKMVRAEALRLDSERRKRAKPRAT